MPTCSMLSSGKGMENWSATAGMVNIMVEYLSHDEQTLAGGVVEAVVMLLVKDELYQEEPRNVKYQVKHQLL